MKILKHIICILSLFVSFALAGPGMADGASKFVGNITTNGQVRSDFGTYWNQITAENECKWASIEGTRGNYNFSGCDRAYNWAKQNGGHFKFHALVWGSQYPSWLNGMSVADTKTAITQWFDRVKKQYPDLEMIDVVNEAIRTSNGQYHSGYGKNNNIIGALGGDNNGDYAFVTNAFKMARERWPNAILIYNDYNTFQWQKDEGIDLVNTIKRNGAPVDAYGQQAHDMMTQGGGNGGTGGGGTCMNFTTFKNTLEEIHNKTQIPLFITEYDIATSDDNTQKKCYQEQIATFMEAPYVAGITIWGYIYGSTWTTDGNSGLIRNGQERPALQWMKDYLSKNKGVNTTGLGGGEPIEPIPQSPFKDTLQIPGKIEMEDFDVSGVGSGNDSYYESDVENHGDIEYREGTGVDFYKKATGVVIGYQDKGEWLEYTVNVKETGTYTMYAAVTSADTNGRFKLSIDGKDITEELKVPKGADTNYTDYSKISTNVNLTKGTHILRYTVTNNWFDIDYITFVNDGEEDPEPIIKDTNIIEIEPPTIEDTITTFIPIDKIYPSLMTFEVFDVNGKYMGLISGYSVDEVRNIIKSKKVGRFIIIDRDNLKFVF